MTYSDKYDSWSSPLLTLEQLEELIQTNGLECHYCKDMTTVIPKSKKDGNQMTLERIDNSKTHRIDNCKIACLECNTMRGASFTSKHFGEIKKRAKSL